MDITRHIENLNQRGGRMLTACDLTAAGTLDIQLQAYLMHAVRRGASIITCAGPGGTGKTTLLGALLTFLPPASRLVVVDSAAPPAWYQKEAKGIGPVWFLCHELGRGPYYSYLWGQNAKTFLEAPAGIPGCYIATTAHADTLEELQDLFRRHLNTAIPAAGGPDCLILFMAAFPLPRPLPTAGLGQRWRRVVTSIYHLSSSGRQGEDRQASGLPEPQLVCYWDKTSGQFLWPHGFPADKLVPYTAFCQSSPCREADLPAARERILRFYDQLPLNQD